MKYNFSDHVRKVLAIAREEAVRPQHDYVGTEHILLGLVRDGEGLGATVLTNLDVDLDEIHERVDEAVPKGKAIIGLGELPYTSRGKKVLEFAMSEAREFSHSYVGTEHFLLGLLCEEKGIAPQVLNSLGVTLDHARAEVANLSGNLRHSDKRAAAWQPLTAQTFRSSASGASQMIFSSGDASPEIIARVSAAISECLNAIQGQEDIDTATAALDSVLDLLRASGGLVGVRIAHASLTNDDHGTETSPNAWEGS